MNTMIQSNANKKNLKSHINNFIDIYGETVIG